MTVRESVVRLGPARLVGVVTEPARRAEVPAAVFLNSGLVHRPGPNRIYVALARRLAALGHRVVRFDFSGIGDSPPSASPLPFVQRAVAETQEVLADLGAHYGERRFLLLGLCSGALVAFRTALATPSVVGAVLINGGAFLSGTDHEAMVQATLAHHYRRMAAGSSFARKNLLKALTGRVDYRGILRTLGAGLRRLCRRSPPLFDRARAEADLATLHGRGVKLLLYHAEADDGLDYVQLVLGERVHYWEAQGLLELQVLPGANHTFTLRWSQAALLAAVTRWVARTFCGQERGES